MTIPVYEPDLSNLEEEFLLDAYRSNWISSRGKYIELFEKSFGDFIGSPRPGLCVSNGTVALHLALVGLGVGIGDEVLVPNFTYIACANAVTYTGAQPVFFDSNIQDLQPNPESAESLITKRTKVIIIPHLYFAAADMSKFREIANRHNLFLIEDCAEAIGTRIDGKHVGLVGDLATFSFYGNKTITTGEGGMVFAKDIEIYEKIRKLKGQGQKTPGSFFHDVVGFNYRMTNIQAAVGYGQTLRIEEILAKKKANHQKYYEGLHSNPNYFVYEPIFGESAYWMETLLISRNLDRKKLQQFLLDQGIETRPGFTLLSKMPMYLSHTYHSPQIESLVDSVLNIPSSSKLTDRDIETVVSALNRFSL